MPADFDPVEFGKMVQAITNLTEVCKELEKKVDDLQGALSSGRGIFIGLTLTAGGVGAVAHKMLEALVK